MDEIIITYLLYAISLVLVISLLSYSVLNYKAGVKNVENSSYDLEAAREDYNIGAYTSDGYYINGKNVEELKNTGKAIILYNDNKEYQWVYKNSILNDYTQLSLINSIDSSDSKIIKIEDSVLTQVKIEEVYKLSTYNATIGGYQVLVYIIE